MNGAGEKLGLAKSFTPATQSGLAGVNGGEACFGHVRCLNLNGIASRLLSMGPRVKKAVVMASAATLALALLASNARRVSIADSEVLNAASAELGIGGTYVGYLGSGKDYFMPTKWEPGAICLALRNWTDASFEKPQCTNIAAWDIEKPADVEWMDFYRGLGKSIPNYEGVMTLSLPIFSPDGQRAYLWYDIWHGPLSAEGGFLTLEKRDGKWVAVNRDVRVVS